MYWDVVEVVPKADYCLFVRFKDGLQGLVHLRREQLTGALNHCVMRISSNRFSSMTGQSLGRDRSIQRRMRCTPNHGR
jgi:hypothetical protein